MTAATEDFNLPAWDRLEGLPDPAENRSLVGHRETLDFLAARLAGGRMHHAWLINGPRGIGKATAALRFAGHVLRHGGDPQPPAAYVEPGPGDPVEARIGRGAHPDLAHLRRPWNEQGRKWRSDLTVGEVRRLIPFFGNASAGGGWRVVVVDTADDLNSHSANALLKILEEPPPQTLFLVLAHSYKGMLSTLRSRCQTLSMRPLAPAQLVQALEILGVASDMAPEDVALAAGLGGGSVRRAILIAQADGISLYRRFRALAGATADRHGPDWAAIHKLAGDIAPAARNDQYRLLFDLAHDYVGRRLRGEAEPGDRSAVVGKGEVSELAQWVEVWEKTRLSLDQADTYNLDRKQVVLNLFAAIHGAV